MELQQLRPIREMDPEMPKDEKYKEANRTRTEISQWLEIEDPRCVDNGN
jgi:hypothetical protein